METPGDPSGTPSCSHHYSPSGRRGRSYGRDGGGRDPLDSCGSPNLTLKDPNSSEAVLDPKGRDGPSTDTYTRRPRLRTVWWFSGAGHGGGNKCLGARGVGVSVNRKSPVSFLFPGPLGGSCGVSVLSGSSSWSPSRTHGDGSPVTLASVVLRSGPTTPGGTPRAVIGSGFLDHGRTSTKSLLRSDLPSPSTLFEGSHRSGALVVPRRPSGPTYPTPTGTGHRTGEVPVLVGSGSSDPPSSPRKKRGGLGRHRSPSSHSPLLSPVQSRGPPVRRSFYVGPPTPSRPPTRPGSGGTTPVGLWGFLLPSPEPFLSVRSRQSVRSRP